MPSADTRYPVGFARLGGVLLLLVGIGVLAGCPKRHSRGAHDWDAIDVDDVLDDARYYLASGKYRSAMQCLDEVRDLAKQRMQPLPSGFDEVEPKIAAGYFARRLRDLDKQMEQSGLDAAVGLVRVIEAEAGTRKIAEDARYAARVKVLDALRSARETNTFVTMAHLTSIQTEAELIGDPTLVTKFESWAADHHLAEAKRMKETMPHASFVHRMLHHYFAQTKVDPGLLASDLERSRVTIQMRPFESVPGCSWEALKAERIVRKFVEGFDQDGAFPIEISGRWFSCKKEVKSGQSTRKKYVTTKIPYEVPIKRRVAIMGTVEYPCQTFKSIGGRPGKYSVHRVSSTCKMPGVVGVRTEVVGKQTRYRYETRAFNETSTFQYDVIKTRASVAIRSPHDEKFASLSNFKELPRTRAENEDGVARVVYEVVALEEQRLLAEAKKLETVPGGLNAAMDKVVRAARLRQSLPLTPNYKRALAQAKDFSQMGKRARKRFESKTRSRYPRRGGKMLAQMRYAQANLRMSADVIAFFEANFGLSDTEVEMLLEGRVPDRRTLKPNDWDPRARHGRCDRMWERVRPTQSR